MAHESKIEWTEATWNPWHGCHKVSQGCKNCYMFRDKLRYGQDPNVVVRSKTKFYDPLKWTEPRTIFTCSWSDFFIEEADAWRDEAFAVMALTPQHTYQVLTKRPERMLEYLSGNWHSRLIPHLRKLGRVPEGRGTLLSTVNMALPNVWLGVSVEDQKTADERIPLLLKTPAAIRWLSVEPLLGPVDIKKYIGLASYDGNIPGICVNIDGETHHNADEQCDSCGWGYPNDPDWPRRVAGIDWVVAGGESGPDARPMHPDWARSIRDQCTAAGVPFFFKQWGEWAPYDRGLIDSQVLATPGATDRPMQRFGKTKAGRTLDGRTWDEMPEVSR